MLEFLFLFRRITLIAPVFSQMKNMFDETPDITQFAVLLLSASAFALRSTVGYLCCQYTICVIFTLPSFVQAKD